VTFAPPGIGIDCAREKTDIRAPYVSQISVSAKRSHTHTYPSLSEPPAALLEWPTLEGLEEFVEKKVEYGEMMEDQVSDLEAVIQDQIVLVKGMKRAAELAEERRLQELQRALERMDPAEAEAARRAERERAFRFQRRYVARLVELDAKWTHISDGV
jgi:hypothetical protein